MCLLHRMNVGRGSFLTLPARAVTSKAAIDGSCDKNQINLCISMTCAVLFLSNARSQLFRDRRFIRFHPRMPSAERRPINADGEQRAGVETRFPPKSGGNLVSTRVPCPETNSECHRWIGFVTSPHQLKLRAAQRGPAPKRRSTTFSKTPCA